MSHKPKPAALRLTVHQQAQKALAMKQNEVSELLTHTFAEEESKVHKQITGGSSMRGVQIRFE